MLFWFQKFSSINKLPISKVESFLKSNLDQNQICNIMLTQNHEIWNFNAIDLLYILLKTEEILWSYGKCQRKLNIDSDLADLWPKICLFRQSRTKHWNKIEKFKFDRTKKVWYLLLCVFWLIFLMENLALDTMSPPILETFLIFLNFLKL